MRSGYQRKLKWFSLAIIAGLAVFDLSLACGFLFPGLTGGRAIKTCTHDLNRNGIHEQYILKNQGLSIIENRETLWRSPAAWRVEHFILADATNDGRDDLLMAVWTKGKFGRHKPLWVSREDNRWSNHLYVFNLAGNRLIPVWMSSGLDRPILELEIEDVNGDKKYELTVVEVRYSPLALPFNVFSFPRETTVWHWDSWGFSRLNEPDVT